MYAPEIFRPILTEVWGGAAINEAPPETAAHEQHLQHTCLREKEGLPVSQGAGNRAMMSQRQVEAHWRHRMPGTAQPHHEARRRTRPA